MYDLSLSVLKFQIGFPVNDKLSVKGSIEDVILSVNEYDIQSFDYSDRIEHSILNTNKRLKSYDLKNNRSQFLPQIYANLSYGYNTSSSEYDLFLIQIDGKIMGPLVYRLLFPFLMDSIKSKINRSKIVIQQVENQIKFLERSIDLQINKIYRTQKCNWVIKCFKR